MKEKRDYSKVKVTHIMADGSIRDSMKGYVTRADQLPLVTREIIRKMMTAESSNPR